jgi:hypothetical protein
MQLVPANTASEQHTYSQCGTLTCGWVKTHLLAAHACASTAGNDSLLLTQVSSTHRTQRLVIR